MSDWSLLRAILVALGRPVTVVVDDVDPLLTAFGVLSAILAEPEVAIAHVLVAQERTVASLEACDRFFSGHGFTRVVLEPVDAGFLARVIRRTTAVMGISLTDGAVDELVVAARRSGETLGQTAALCGSFGQRGVQEGWSAFWQEVLPGHDRDELSLLLTIEGLRWCGLSSVPVDALRLLYEYEVPGGAPFDAVLARVVSPGWVTSVDGAVGMVSEGNPVVERRGMAWLRPRGDLAIVALVRRVALVGLAVREELGVAVRQAVFGSAKVLAMQGWTGDALLLWRATLADADQLSLAECVEVLDFLAYLWVNIGERGGYVRDMESLVASRERLTALWAHAFVFLRRAGWQEEWEQFVEWLLHRAAVPFEARVKHGIDVLMLVHPTGYLDEEWLSAVYDRWQNELSTG